MEAWYTYYFFRRVWWNGELPWNTTVWIALDEETPEYSMCKDTKIYCFKARLVLSSHLSLKILQMWNLFSMNVIVYYPLVCYLFHYLSENELAFDDGNQKLATIKIQFVKFLPLSLVNLLIVSAVCVLLNRFLWILIENILPLDIFFPEFCWTVNYLESHQENRSSLLGYLLTVFSVQDLSRQHFPDHRAIFW